MKKLHKSSEVHAEKEIENAKPCVPGKCFVVSVNFDKILSEKKQELYATSR